MVRPPPKQPFRIVAEHPQREDVPEFVDQDRKKQTAIHMPFGRGRLLARRTRKALQNQNFKETSVPNSRKCHSKLLLWGQSQSVGMSGRPIVLTIRRRPGRGKGGQGSAIESYPQHPLAARPEQVH
jgi:hypothetical protein